MFTEMMPMGGGGGDSSFNAVSGSGTDGTAKTDLVIHTGLSEVHKFVFITHTDGANPTYGSTFIDDSYDANEQLSAFTYSNNTYVSRFSFPYTSTNNTGYSIIRNFNDNGVAGDVRVMYSANGSGEYEWFAI